MLEYLTEIAFGILITIFSFVLKKIMDYKKTMTSTINGVKALLKSQIIESYCHLKKEGNVTIHEKEMLNELYSEYRNLGGNGVIETLVKEIIDMDINNNKNKLH